MSTRRTFIGRGFDRGWPATLTSPGKGQGFVAPWRETYSKEVRKVRQSSREVGLRGEDIAVRYLEALGFSIVLRNFRSRFGEIDLIVEDGDTIVFVEVKTRRSRRFGKAVEQITPGKQRKIMKAAGEYLQRCGALGSKVRFDVLAIDILPGGAERVEQIKGAFNGWR